MKYFIARWIIGLIKEVTGWITSFGWIAGIIMAAVWAFQGAWGAAAIIFVLGWVLSAIGGVLATVLTNWQNRLVGYPEFTQLDGFFRPNEEE